MTYHRQNSVSDTFGTLLLRALPGFACLLFWSGSFAQESVDIDQLQRREDLQRRFNEMESTLGNRDPALIEQLASLAESANALGLYSEANTLLDQAIQIERLNSGLYSHAQIPLYLNMMANSTLQGDWSNVNKLLDYLDWLLRKKNLGNEQNRIDYLIRLSEFHLQGVADDAIELQAHHYREAMELVVLALSIGERNWQPHDPRKLDLYYSLLKHHYLQSLALARRDDTAYALRAVVPGSKWVLPRHLVQARNYRSGLQLFEEIRKILIQSSESPAESLAMLDLYIADWHVLFNQKRAELLYQQAYQALAQANTTPEQLGKLFLRPQILPIANFHTTASQAIAAVDADTGRIRATDHADFADATGYYFSLQEWFEAMPMIAFPITAPAIAPLTSANSTDTWLRFRLNSLDTVSRWIGGTYRSHIGVVEEFNILGNHENPASTREYLNNRLHFLRFRPRLENGMVQAAEGTLLYRAVQ